VAVLYLDSFDDRSGSTLGGERYDASAVNSSSGITSGGRTANYLYLAQNQYVQKVVAPSPSTTLFIGFAYNPSTLPSGTSTIAIIQDAAGLTHCLLRVNSDGTVSVVNNGGTVLGTSTQVIAAATWQYLEFTLVVNASTGSATVKLNGTSIVTVTGANTHGGSTTVIGKVELTWTNATGTGGFDDFYICDTSGSLNTTFLGLLKIECLHPTGAGTHTQFTPVGLANNWDCAKDANYNDDTDYVSSATVGNMDTYAHGALSSTAVTITACQVVMRVRKDDVLARSVAPVIRSGGTDYTETTIALSGTSYADFTQVLETDPHTSAAWLATAVNSAEIGVTVIA
jgi:hypothetical protein